MRAFAPLVVSMVVGIGLGAGACASPPTKSACAVIDLANTACTLFVRLEDGRTVEVPKEAVRASALARLAASASASSKP